MFYKQIISDSKTEKSTNIYRENELWILIDIQEIACVINFVFYNYSNKLKKITIREKIGQEKMR